MRKDLRLGLIGSYVPKKCGIATFGRDLVEGMRQNNRYIQLFIAPAEKDNEGFEYGNEAIACLKTNDRNSYINAAKKFNELNLNVVLLQHEFGLFGGSRSKFTQDGVQHDDPTGDWIFELINEIDVPLITTFHTILPYPDHLRKEVTRRIADRSAVVVTMTQDSKRILCADYQIAETKIVVVPHGVPSVPVKDRGQILTNLELPTDKFYLVITGLINANKGIDVVIRSLPKVLAKHPNVHLLVVGQTHPQVLENEGETYRNKLKTLAKSLGVANAITFINEYLETNELMGYLSASDIYLTIHKDPEQSASGTLAYAIGTGLLTISTPYRYAQELLSKGRGMLVPFNDHVGLSDAINRIIDDDGLRQKTFAALKKYSPKMEWPLVGKSYLKLLKDYANI